MTKLKIFANHDQEVKLLEKSITDLYDGKTELVILEAGCGRKWLLNLAGTKYKLIGVDLDAEALSSRVNNEKDLDEAIVADLQDFDIGRRQVDVVYNSFVLEHIENADKMLENFDRLLRAGGLLILKFPDRNTVFGFVTRSTPFWFHVLFKKYMQGLKDAGKPGFAPYPTYYHPIVSRDGIHEFCRSHGYAIKEEYGFCGYLSDKSLKTKFIRVLAILISAASLGKLPWDYNNLTYVLSKNG